MTQRWVLRVRCGLLSAVLLSAVVTAQDRPVFRARAELVQLDVIVVDADGHAVHGLKQTDFQVLDRGKPQRLAAFEEISHERPASPSLPADLRLDVADNATRPDRVIVLVLDDLHFQAKAADVKAMARRVVTDIGPRAALALVTTSGTFGVEPTEDRALLLSEIDRFMDRFDPEMRRLARGAQMPVPAPVRNAMGEVVPERGHRQIGSFFGDMGTYKTVTDVAKKLGVDVAGRRNAFVWISGGMNAPSAAQCDADLGNAFYCGELAGLLESLRKSNATAYAVHTGDFRPTLLKDVADRSGGFVLNARDFDRDLPRLIDDLDHYYLLGFYPDDPKDGSYRALEVVVNRPGLSVRHRRGYKTGEQTSKPRNRSPLARLAEGVLPVGDLSLRAASTALPPAGRESRVVVTLEARVPRSALQEADGHLRDVLRYEVWAVDLRRKKVVKSVAREARFVLDPGEAAANTADPVAFQVRSVLSLQPGRYQLRASATSAKLAKGGSVYLENEVPDVRTRGLDIGGIVLGYADGPRVPIVRGGAAAGLLPIEPTLDREFARADAIRMVCDLTKPALASIDTAVDLLGPAGVSVKRLQSRRFERAEPSRLAVLVPLKDLEPGGYRVRVTVTGEKGSITREAGFIVK
jgi:VWFA-related protein